MECNGIKNKKDICRVGKFLIISFLLLCGCPSICLSTGINDKEITYVKPDKKFINHFFNATELHRKGDLSKAPDEYNKVLEYYPSNPMILNCIGRVYWQMGDSDRAVAIFQRILNESDNAQTEVKARSSLGVIYMNKGNYARALEELERCLDLEPELSRQIAYQTVINKCKEGTDHKINRRDLTRILQ